jgi:hypothetical protein
LSIQSLIFSKNKFPKREDAVKWAKQKGYKTYTSRETKNTWRLRQYPPNECKGDFRIGDLSKGIKAVYCINNKSLKEQIRKSAKNEIKNKEER